MELHTWFWGLLLMKFLCLIPVACPSITSVVNTQESENIQATSSRTHRNVSFEATKFTKEVKTFQGRTIQTGMTIQPIRTFNVTRMKQAARMGQTVKTIQVDRTVHPAITAESTGGRLCMQLLLLPQIVSLINVYLAEDMSTFKI